MLSGLSCRIEFCHDPGNSDMRVRWQVERWPDHPAAPASHGCIYLLQPTVSQIIQQMAWESLWINWTTPYLILLQKWLQKKVKTCRRMKIIKSYFKAWEKSPISTEISKNGFNDHWKALMGNKLSHLGHFLWTGSGKRQLLEWILRVQICDEMWGAGDNKCWRLSSPNTEQSQREIKR